MPKKADMALNWIVVLNVTTIFPLISDSVPCCYDQWLQDILVGLWPWVMLTRDSGDFVAITHGYETSSMVCDRESWPQEVLEAFLPWPIDTRDPFGLSTRDSGGLVAMSHGYKRSFLASDHESCRQEILEALFPCLMATRDPGWLVTVTKFPHYRKFSS